MRVCGKSDQGRVKKSNQDRYAAEELPGGGLLAVVSDGMGGEAGGEVAAEMVIDALRGFKAHEDGSKTLVQAMADMAEETGERIQRRGEDEPALKYMGATLTGAVIQEHTCSWVHVGDSRLYLLRNGVMEQVTTDHRFVQEFIDCGELTEEQAAEHPMAHVLDQSLGTPGAVPDTGVISLQPDDILLFCSDGLTDELSPAVITAVLRTEEDLCGAVDKLVSGALEAGGHDNVTVVAVRIG